MFILAATGRIIFIDWYFKVVKELDIRFSNVYSILVKEDVVYCGGSSKFYIVKNLEIEKEIEGF